MKNVGDILGHEFQQMDDYGTLCEPPLYLWQHENRVKPGHFSFSIRESMRNV